MRREDFMRLLIKQILYEPLTWPLLVFARPRSLSQEKKSPFHMNRLISNRDAVTGHEWLNYIVVDSLLG